MTKPKKLHCCTTYAMQLCNFYVKERNTIFNSDATIGPKGLSGAPLQCNRQCNSDATYNKSQCNFAAKKVDEKLHSNSVISKHEISMQGLKQESKKFFGEDQGYRKNNPASNTYPQF